MTSLPATAFDVPGMFSIYNKLTPYVFRKPIQRITSTLASCLLLSFVPFFDKKHLIVESPKLYKGKSSTLFTPSEDIILLHAAIATNFDFRAMKAYLANKTVDQIRCHWSNMCKPAARDNPIRRYREEIEQSPMTSEEIERFRQTARTHGFHWTKLTQQFAPRGVKNLVDIWTKHIQHLEPTIIPKHPKSTAHVTNAQ